jgi:hypothetical protein
MPGWWGCTRTGGNEASEGLASFAEKRTANWGVPSG